MLIDEMIRPGIQNIDEKVKAMRHILEWIDLNEQAPGYKQECIVQFESGEVQGGWLYGGQSRSGEHIFLESHAEYEVSMDVAFWMSLPPAQPEQLAVFPPTI